MVIFFTMLQIIRSEYTTEGSKNAKGPIIKTALKSLFLFGLIPVASILGVVLCNDLLFIVDKATTRDAEVSLAGMIFVSSAKDANPWRRLEEGEKWPVEWAYAPGNSAYIPQVALSGYFGDGIYEDSTGVFKVPNTKGWAKVYYGKNSTKIECSDYVLEHEITSADQLDQMFKVLSTSDKVTKVKSGSKAITLFKGDVVSYTNIRAVYYFYNLRNINYIFLYAGGWFALKALWSVMFGVIMRMYRLAVLFVISPFPVSLSVLDNGQALNKWKQLFISNLFSAYGVIVALNLIFMVIPEVENIEVFTGGEWYAGLFNMVIQMIIIIVGCMMIKDIAGMMSGFFGGGNALDEGEGMAKQVTDFATSGVKAAASVAMTVGAGIATGGAAIAGMAAKGAGAIAGKLGRGARGNEAMDVEDKEADETIAKETKNISMNTDRLNFLNSKSSLTKEEEAEKKTLEKENEQSQKKIDKANKIKDSNVKRRAWETSNNPVKRGMHLLNNTRLNEGILKGVRNFASDENQENIKVKSAAVGLRGTQILKSQFMNIGAVKAFNEGTMGMLTKEGRQKLDKSIVETGGPAAQAVLKAAEKDYTTKDFKGRETTGIRTSALRSGFMAFAEKFAATQKNKEQNNKFVAAAKEASDAQNSSIDDADETTRMLADGENINIAQVNTDNLRIKADSFEANGDNASAINYRKMADEIDHAKKLDPGAEQDKYIKNAKIIANSMAGNNGSAQRVSFDSASAKLKIDDSSIDKFARYLERSGKAGAAAFAGDKSISAAIRNTISKAIEAVNVKATNMKNDPKQENIIAELLRELISKVQK